MKNLTKPCSSWHHRSTSSDNSSAYHNWTGNSASCNRHGAFLQNSPLPSYNWSSADLWRQNDAFASDVIPAMVFLGVVMLVGAVGNALVVYVYAWRVKMTTQYFLILCLACSDLVICLLAIPTDITDLRFPLTFNSDPACRLLRFVTMFCFVFSNFLLIVIAVDRFRRVCRPIGLQMALREARWAAALSGGAALLVAWPLLVLAGLRTAETSLPGLYGQDCSFSDTYKDTPYPLALNVALGTGFVVMTFTLAVLYFRIWSDARRRHAFRLEKQTASRSLSSSSGGSSCSNTTNSNSNRDGSNISASTSTLTCLSASTTSIDNQAASVVTVDRRSRSDSVFTVQRTSAEGDLSWRRLRSTGASGRAVDKITIVAFTVTLVFVLSFLPYLILMFVRALVRDFDYSLREPAALNVYNIFLRFYYINSAANPIVYGALSLRFRAQCRALLRRLKCACVRFSRQQATSSSC